MTENATPQDQLVLVVPDDPLHQAMTSLRQEIGLESFMKTLKSVQETNPSSPDGEK